LLHACPEIRLVFVEVDVAVPIPIPGGAFGSQVLGQLVKAEYAVTVLIVSPKPHFRQRIQVGTTARTAAITPARQGRGIEAPWTAAATSSRRPGPSRATRSP